MHLVIGGAYQGKKEYVKKKYSIEESDIWQGGYPVAGGQWRCINGLHKIVRSMMEKLTNDDSGEQKVRNDTQRVENYVNQIADYLLNMAVQMPDLILVCDEVGNGIVPMEKAERDYRECVGKRGFGVMESGGYLSAGCPRNHKPHAALPGDGRDSVS